MKGACRSILIFVFCCINTLSVLAQEKVAAWEKKADFVAGGRMSGAISFSIGTKRYICCGTDGEKFNNRCWEYNSETDTWRKMADFPGEARADGVSFTIGNKAYVGSGNYDYLQEKKGTNDFWEYDPAKNSWTKIADLPSDPREGAIGFSLGDKGYVGLGAAPGKAKYCNDLWEYNPSTNQWTKKADFPEKGREGASVFVINSSAYVLFGGKAGEIGVGSKSVWSYNSQKNDWEKESDFLGPARIGAVAFSMDKKGYVGTGYNGVAKYYNDLWEYDPKLKIWNQKPDANFDARCYAFAFVIDNTAYIGTGAKKQLISGGGSIDIWQVYFKPSKVSVDYNAKLLYDDKNKKVPLAKQGITLLGAEKNVIETTTTDNSGLFAFKELDVTGKYQLVLAKNDNLPANAVVSLAKPNGRIIEELKKNSDSQFTYELQKLDEIEEDDSYFNLQYFTKSEEKEVTITSNIYYSPGSAELTKEGKTILYQVVVSLNQYPNLLVAISSHTDSQGDDAFNMQLSEKRAKTALDYIVLNGIDSKRVSAKGFGETKILNKCKNGVTCTEEEHKVNRRTEFKFIKQ